MSKNPSGMGSYKKRSDGRYEWSQMVDGKRRYLSAKTLKELKQKVSLVSDKPIDSSRITFEEYANLWLSTRIKPLKEPATYENYKYHLKSSVYPYIGNKKLQKLTIPDVQSLIATAHEQGRSNESMKHIKSITLSVLRQAKKDNLIAECPHREDIEIPATAPVERVPHIPSKMAEILNAFEKSRWKWSVWYALCTGSRRSEIVGLKWSDIDRENGRIRNYNVKTKKVAYIPIAEEIDHVLNEQGLMLRREGLGFSPFVFPNNRGEQMDAGAYTKAIIRLSKKYGVQTSPHKFRHTFVFAVKDKLTLSQLQSILGHSRSTHTLDIYGKMINDDTSKIKPAMDNAMRDYIKQMKNPKEKIKKISEGETGT